jgi:erythritol transport system ATP-binding protein
MRAEERDIILEARCIVRRYPGTTALKGVTYRVYRNQVNVLIGENGAGKSTLMRILAGVEQPDEGELLLDGRVVRFPSPRDAVRHGISTVHQELSILPNLNLAENIFAGREPVKMGVLLDHKTQDRRSDAALRRLRGPSNILVLAGSLSLGSRQMVEVARTLDQGARILILDEPTSALSNAEADSLMQVITELKQSGVTILYISHRLHELLHLGDRFTVLRSGQIAGEATRETVSRSWIVDRMSGKETTVRTEAGPSPSRGDIALGVERLSLPSLSAEGGFQSALTNVSFSLRKGEILGIYGLLGAGRTELLECLVGKRRAKGGRILVHGKEVKISSVTDAAKHGIFLVPEDRQRDGLFSELSIRENIVLGARDKIFLDRRQETLQVGQIARELNIAAREFELPVAALSGGNQQKVLIARCLLQSPAVLLLDEPTRGVDVSAKAEIYALLRQLAGRGLSILFASSEIEETMFLAEHVLVLCQGSITAEFSRAEMTDKALFSAASPLVRTHAEMSVERALV